MEKIFRKGLSSLLIIMMLLAIAMPAIVHAADESMYKISDMKLNTVIYFEGQTYSSIHYKCNNAKYKKEYKEEETPALVWKINKKYNSIVVQLNTFTFRTIKVDQVTDIREEKFLTIQPSSMEELRNKELKLNIKIEGVQGKVTEFNNSGNLRIDADGYLVVGIEDGLSEIVIDGVPITIMRDASGHVALDISDRCISADARAVLLEKLEAGGEVALRLEDGGVRVEAGADIADAEGNPIGGVTGDAALRLEDGEVKLEGGADLNVLGNDVGGADAALRYDLTNIADPDNDIKADVGVNVLGAEFGKSDIDTHIIKTIKKLVSKIKARL